MRYPILIEPATGDTCFGVQVPDFPGCFSAGDTVEEAIRKAEESAAAWIDATLDDGEIVPSPSSWETVRAIEPNWIVSYIEVNPADLDDSVERVNITMPRRVLRRLDALARAEGESRSGYIVTMTLKGSSK